jgi:hypothetical protein
MDLEEYLKKRIKELEEGPLSLLAVDEVLAFKEILSKLPELEHDVTLKEVVEECKDCYGCSFCLIGENEDGSPFQAGCLCDGCPGNWDIDAIQKCMKEVRDD